MQDNGESRWAKPVDRLHVDQLPEGARSAVNVNGRRLTGPMRGFGRLWQKTYRVRLEGVTAAPDAVIRTWKEHYGEFWPRGNRFFPPLTGIAPGEVGLIRGGPVATGVMVLYSDDVSFAFMTPEGHPFAAWITFSAEQDADDVTLAQVFLQIRASDPIFELAMPLGVSRMEDRMWQHTLSALARHVGVTDPVVDTRVELLDRRRQWRYFGSVRHNAVLRSIVHPLGAPARAVARARQR